MNYIKDLCRSNPGLMMAVIDVQVSGKTAPKSVQKYSKDKKEDSVLGRGLNVRDSVTIYILNDELLTDASNL